MKQIWLIRIRPEPWTRHFARGIHLLFFGLFIASCGGGGSNDDSMHPSPILGSNATLASLSINGADLDPAFDSSVTDYTAAVGFAAKSTQVTATVEDVSANLSVNGTAVNSGVASDSISLDEGTNTITVNVIAEDGITEQTYTVVVNRQSASAFAQKAYVKAFDPSQNDAFGAKLALSGDGAKLAVAAPFGGLEFCGEEPWVGRPQPVYEYERDDNGVWGELQKIVEFSAPHKIANVDFSADGSTLTVSARDLGLFVFSREGDGVWTQQKLDIQSPIASFYGFNMVALSADGATLAVVVSFSFPPSSIEALYIFTRDSDGNWTEQAEITDDKYFLNCCDFTPDISLSGDGATLAVSRLNRVYVFGRDNNNAWTERAELQQFSNDSEDNLLGDSVELSRDGTTLAAGATAAGSVYLFRTDSNNVWTEEAFVRPSVRATDQFGWSVALSADGAMLAVGAPFEDSGATGVNGDELNNDAIDSGAAWVFARDSFGVWTQRAYLKASTTLNTRHFGAAVSLSDDGTILAVGVPGDSSAATGVNGDSIEFGPGCAGATYIFEL